MQHTLIACNSIKSIKKGRKRRIWTQPRSGNFFENDLNTCNDDIFKENLRVSRETFQFLTEKLDGMKKQDTIFRKAISLEKRIAVALYTLGSSSEFRTVANLFGIGKSTVTKILEDFTHEVVSALKESYLDKNNLKAH
uniref:CSON010726 protein n=1 Tax=Culicoides sonorensis TaxID=179676 RepID=A0A336MZF5_CULSO